MTTTPSVTFSCIVGKNSRLIFSRSTGLAVILGSLGLKSVKNKMINTIKTMIKSIEVIPQQHFRHLLDLFPHTMISFFPQLGVGEFGD